MKTPCETEWELLRAHKLPDALKHDIHDADRFAFQSMHVIYDEVTGPIFDAVEGKLRSEPGMSDRTVLLPDSFSFFPREADKAQRDEEIERLSGAIQRYRDLGATALAGSPSALHPQLLKRGFRFLGRDHARLIVAGNSTYISNVNFYRESFQDIGYVIKVTDATVADKAHDIVRAKAEGWDAVRDRIVTIDDSHSLLMTAGALGSSMILWTAEELARDAERGSIRFSSQLRPGGKIEGLLRENVARTVAFNRPENLRDGAMRQEQKIAARRGALPNMVMTDRYNNAKLISVILRRDRERQALPDHAGPAMLIGSDNMHQLASRFACTKECVLLTTDEKLITEVNAAVDEDFASAA